MLIHVPIGSQCEAAFAWDWRTGRSRFLGQGRECYGAQASATEICGTADLVWRDRSIGKGLIRDYKTGYASVTSAEKNAQLTFLALCIATVPGAELDHVVGEIVYIHEEQQEPSVDRAFYSRPQLEAFASKLSVMISTATAMDGGLQTYREGPHCRYCPSYDWCPPKKELITTLAAGEFDLATAYFKTRELERTAKRALERLKEHSDRELIDLGNGRVYGRSPAGKYEEHTR